MPKQRQNKRPLVLQLRRAGVVLALAAAATGCAPDSVRNMQATGFNGYLDTLKSACKPLMLGSANVSDWLWQMAPSDPNYSYWLDMTSRLYYGRISPESYRVGITGFLGVGSSDDSSYACIFRNLPADRPSAPN
jgi:hypothetical protein